MWKGFHIFALCFVCTVSGYLCPAEPQQTQCIIQICVLAPFYCLEFGTLGFLLTRRKKFIYIKYTVREQQTTSKKNKSEENDLQRQQVQRHSITPLLVYMHIACVALWGQCIPWIEVTLGNGVKQRQGPVGQANIWEPQQIKDYVQHVPSSFTTVHPTWKGEKHTNLVAIPTSQHCRESVLNFGSIWLVCE